MIDGIPGALRHVILLLLGVMLTWGGVNAMNMNVQGEYADKCSRPQKSEFAFYSRQAEDLLFTDQDEIIIFCQAGLRSVRMHWALSRNAFVKPFREGEAEPMVANRFRIRIPTAGLHPGSYDLRVKLDSGMGTPIDGICTFGYRATELPIRDTRPADFAAFWAEAKTKVAEIPLAAEAGPLETFTADAINAYNVKRACLPADYDPAGHRYESVESGKVSFAGPAGGRVYGWLAKPHGPGPFPAMLVLPGAGFNARTRPLEHARHGYLALDIQVHGQDVDLPQYENLPGYFDHQVYEPVNAFYFYNVHLRVLQAINYLVSRPDVDPTRIVVVGGSQGGRLGIVAAGIDSRIAAVVSCIANSPNQPYLKWADACNPDPPRKDGKPQPPKVVRDGMELAMPPSMPNTPAARCLPYYDPMNFAEDIHCPVLMNVGLVDPISPPASVFAVYNRLGTPDKQMITLPGLGHDWSAEFDRQAWQWLREKLQRTNTVAGAAAGN